jgi:hypothetical protein
MPRVPKPTKRTWHQQHKLDMGRFDSGRQTYEDFMLFSYKAQNPVDRRETSY